MPNNIGNSPLWFGYTTDFWNSVSSKLLMFAVVTGILAAIASGLSSWIGSVVTSRIQDAAGVRIGATELELQKSRERTVALEASVAEANARAAEANKIAEQERLARVKIEEKLAPRQLSAEQVNRLAAHLSKWARLPAGVGRQNAAVFPTGTSFESAALADQIATSLGPNGAGWVIDRHPVTYGLHFSVGGVGVLTSSNSRAIQVAAALVEAMNKEGIFSFVLPERRRGCEETPNFKGNVNADPWCSAISVFVGDHP